MHQFIRNLGAALARIYLLPWYFLSGFIPRRDNLWVFGSWGGQRYADNSAALFRYCHDHCDDPIELVWISHRLDIVRQLRSLGFNAYWWWSPVGIVKCLRARLHLFDCFSKDINFWMSRGATLINLWSGVPLKSFERDIDISSSRYYRLFHGSPIERLVLSALMPWHAIRPDLIIATSPEAQTIIARAFDVPTHRVPVTGLPRNDCLLAPSVSDQLPDAIVSAIESRRRIFFYLPTFRDSGRTFTDFDWSSLDNLLEQNNACLMIKFHPVDDTLLSTNARHVHVLGRDLDVYKLLPHTNTLISDYSSVIWDYLLLRRPIILFAPDLEDFSATSRSLNFDLDDLAIGPVCSTFDELTEAMQDLCENRQDDIEAARQQAKLFSRIHSHSDAESSKRVLHAIKRAFPTGDSAQPGWLDKLCYKLRYNSWPRLTMNALKRIGLTILPYYVFRRDITIAEKHPAPDSYEYGELTSEDMPDVAALPLVHSSEQIYRTRLSNGQRCFALKREGVICAFSWMDPNHFSFPAERTTLRSDEVYMYDIYTTLAMRGQNLAAILTACYTAKLRAEGVSTILSVVDSFNRPSLNYIKKAGGRMQRKNLYLNFFGLIEKSIVLKVYDANSGAE